MSRVEGHCRSFSKQLSARLFSPASSSNVPEVMSASTLLGSSESALDKSSRADSFHPSLASVWPFTTKRTARAPGTVRQTADAPSSTHMVIIKANFLMGPIVLIMEDQIV